MRFREIAFPQSQLALAFMLALVSLQVAADVASITGRAVTSSAAGAPAATLLEPGQAFKPQIRLRDQSTVEIRFDVVPGYYLYRDRIRLEGEARRQSVARRKSSTPPADVESTVAKSRYVLTLPPGKSVDDPTFGKVDVFDRSLTFLVDLAGIMSADLPVGGKSAALKKTTPPPTAKLILTSQGCAAAGVCFPAQQHEFPMPAYVSNGKNGSTAEGGWLSPSGAGTSLGFGRSPAQTSSSMSQN